MGGLDDYKPTMVMLGLQFIYAGVTLFSRAALLQEMSPRVFVVYRQAAATLVMASITFLTRRKRSRCCLAWRSFCLIFLTTFIGVTLNQNIYFEGLYLASSSTASAMGNLVPAVTFVLASIVGLEKVNLQSLTSIAKIIGTALCVSGAVAMALLKGPKLLNTELLPPTKSLFGSGGDNWLLGCLLLFGSTCCWSLWLILQVSVCVSYPDHLSLSAWMCFLATLQSATVSLFLEQDLEAWNMHSCLEITACLFTGVAAGVVFFAQAWCIERRGPLFSAMFNPLSTVIVVLFASIFLHEEIYTGSLVGALAVIIGLYVVLWGKAKEHEEINMKTATRSQNDQTKPVDVLTDESTDETTCKIDLEEPLLCEKLEEVGKNQMAR